MPKITFAFISFLLFTLFILPPTYPQDYEVEFRHNVMIPMSDGVELAANIFIPKAEGPFPTILMRSPYGKGKEDFRDGQYYGSHGYAVVIQDTRGKGGSEGEWDPFRYDGQDGYDTQMWIGKQEWCNGDIGTIGGSYVGFTQWISAPHDSPHLKAMVPEVPFAEAYNVMYVGGVYQLALSNLWGTFVFPKFDASKVDPQKLQEGFMHLPLTDWESVVGMKIPYINKWITNPSYNEYWKKRGIGPEGYQNIDMPTLSFGGWYDIFSKATLEIADRVHHQSNDLAMRKHQYVVLGPWHHGGSDNGKVGELDFGELADLDRRPMRLKWFDYWLNHKETGVEDWPPIYLFVMGSNKWRGENEWPLARTEWTKFYINSGGSANTKGGDGALSTSHPSSNETDTYTYDPMNPVPSLGGNHLAGIPPGPYDQSKIEEREDVLVYTSRPLEEDIEVTGPVKMTLYASSSVKDTDFTAKLVDVHPDGKAYNLCDGIVRARYRNGTDEESLIEPGKVYEYEIDLWVTSNTFLKGHRIRVEVSSSNFPRFTRNTNTGNPIATDTEVIKAKQVIYHDTERPSHILLPVIPK